jgi:hypothetical protein
MKKKLLYSVIAIALLSFSSTAFSQVLNLGSLSNFAAYSGTGAVSNAGTSTLAGDIGANSGAVSGFGLPTSITGSLYNANATTTQAKIDLLRVYIHLSDLALTNTTHAAAFGSGETIVAGVYSIGGAGSLAGTITLNGQGNTDAAFVIKFEGGFTAAAGSQIILTNGARACNVFWIAEGAISIGASSITKGTLIAHPGAVTVAAGSTLEGRMFSTEGAITFGPGIATLPIGPITIPISCVNSCNNNILGTAANFALFTSVGAVANAATSGIIGDIGANVGDISGFATSTIAGSFYNVNAVTAQAALDLQAAYTQLVAIPTTNTSHTPAFGSGETLTAGVYAIAAAGSLAGTITLDAQGNPDALFIFKFNGAFTTAAQSKVVFKNGVRRCNVFWIAEGAVSMGTFTFMKGTLIAHNGANTMGANGNLEGRMLSTTGAIGFSTGVIYNSTMCFPDPTAVIYAANDALTVNGFTGGTLTNVLSNDTLNGLAIVPAQATTAFVSSTNTGITLSGTNVIVAAGTPAGTYSLIYKICQISNPTNCTQATVTVNVTAPIITAVNDTLTVNGFTGGTLTNVLSNDTLNGFAVVASQITTAFVSSTNTGITLSGTNVIVAAGTPAGTYSLVYRTCQILNPTNCTQAIVTITVKASVLLAVNDVAVPLNFVARTGYTNILSNDTLNGVAVLASQVSTTFVSATNAGITLSGANVLIANGVPVGTYYLTYRICEVSNTSNCSQAIVTIIIQCAPIVTPCAALIHPTCYSTGTITVTTPIGTGFTYSINGSTYQTSPIFAGLSANNYSVTAKNGTCSSTALIAKLNPGTIPTPTTTVKQTTCASATGTITVGSLGEGYSYSIGGGYQTSPIFTGVTSGTYNVTAMFGTCISIIKVTVVNIQPLTPVTPTVIATQMTATLASATITVTSPLGTGLKYSINGTTYQTSPIFTGLTSACSYNVTVKNAYCTSPVKVVTINRRLTSSKQKSPSEISNRFAVILAPNPSSDVFELAIQSVSDEAISIRIIDMNGRVINTLKSNLQDTNTISFGNDLSSGMYFIEVVQGNQRKVVKAQKL